MKKLLLITAICFVTKNSFAQFNTNLVVSPNPPGALLDWSVKDLTYIISGAAGLAGQAVIKATIKTTDGTVAATTNLAKARVITINPAAGNILLYAADVIPLEVMVFNGKFKVSMERSGKLPAGSYQLCVQLVRPVDFFPMSQEQCRVFNIASFQLPIPMMPANETILDIEKAKNVITFRWTPVSPRPSTVVTYRVTVFEILPGQNSMQALRSNQPLLAKDITATTQFIWQPQLGLTMCNPCGGDLDGDGGYGDGGKVKKDSGHHPPPPHGDPDFDLKVKKDSTKHPPSHGDPDFDLMRMKPDTLSPWGPDMDPDAYAFIWTIQTFDAQGKPFGDGNINGDGISEPNIFFIDRRPPAMRRSGPPSRVNHLNGKRN